MSGRAGLRSDGGAIRKNLFGDDEGGLGLPIAGFADLMSELVYGSIWSRPGLDRPDRMACTLAALCAVQNTQSLRPHVAAALDLAMTPRAIVEILLQVGIYRGFATSQAALAVAAEVFAARGVTPPAAEEDGAEREALAQAGRALQATLHDQRKDLGYAAPDDPVASTIYPLVVQYCYGAIWHRPGLDHRLRALCAVAAFTALDRRLLLEKFAVSALNVGATQGEVIEAIIQTGPYTGFAFMLTALTTVAEAFAIAAGGQ